MRKSLKQWLLGGVATLALSVALSGAPAAEIPTPSSVGSGSKVFADFSKATEVESVLRLEGDQVKQLRLSNIVEKLMKLKQGRRLFEQNAGMDWTLAFDPDLVHAKEYFGQACLGERRITVSPVIDEDEVVPVLGHEMTHAQQDKLGFMSVSRRTLAEFFLEYKVSEAIARTVETELAFEAGGLSWSFYKTRDAKKPLVDAWVKAYGEHPETATQSARLAVFDAFFDTALRETYEQECLKVLEKCKQQGVVSGDGLALLQDETCSSGDLVASMTLNGLEGVGEGLPGFCKNNPRYAGVSEATRARLAQLFPGAALPPLRKTPKGMVPKP